MSQCFQGHYHVSATLQDVGPSELVHDDLFNADNEPCEVFKSRQRNQNRKVL